MLILRKITRKKRKDTVAFKREYFPWDLCRGFKFTYCNRYYYKKFYNSTDYSHFKSYKTYLENVRFLNPEVSSMYDYCISSAFKYDGHTETMKNFYKLVEFI